MEPTPVQPTSGPVMFRYAGFWKRFLAYIIDQLVISVFALMVFLPILGMIGFSLWSQDFEPTDSLLVTLVGMYMLAILATVMGEWLYYAIMESTKGATLGKMALGIIVTDLQGRKISFGRASGRYFGKILSSLILGIGYIMAGLTQQKQALHDMLASCLVINK